MELIVVGIFIVLDIILAIILIADIRTLGQYDKKWEQLGDIVVDIVNTVNSNSDSCLQEAEERKRNSAQIALLTELLGTKNVQTK